MRSQDLNFKWWVRRTTAIYFKILGECGDPNTPQPQTKHEIRNKKKTFDHPRAASTTYTIAMRERLSSSHAQFFFGKSSRVFNVSSCCRQKNRSADSLFHLPFVISSLIVLAAIKWTCSNEFKYSNCVKRAKDAFVYLRQCEKSSRFAVSALLRAIHDWIFTMFDQ